MMVARNGVFRRQTAEPETDSGDQWLFECEHAQSFSPLSGVDRAGRLNLRAALLPWEKFCAAPALPGQVARSEGTSEG